MKKIGIIDISSSSISLLIARTENGNIERIFRNRKNISVFDFLDNSFSITEKGINRISDAVVAFIEDSKNLEVECIYTISTLRKELIKNADALINEIKSRTGATVYLLDYKSEAYADYIANEKYSILPKALLIDIGGSSTELCNLNTKNKDDMTSLALGSISLYKQFSKKASSSDKEADDMKDYVKDIISSEKDKKASEFENAVLLGASVLSLYDVYSDYYDIIPENGEKIIQYKKLKKLIKYLTKHSEKPELIIKNAPERIHLIIPTAIIAKELLKKYGVANAIISDLGVKEGYLKLIESKEVSAEGLCL